MVIWEIKVRPSLVFQSFKASSDTVEDLITHCLRNLRVWLGNIYACMVYVSSYSKVHAAWSSVQMLNIEQIHISQKTSKTEHLFVQDRLEQGVGASMQVQLVSE